MSVEVDLDCSTKFIVIDEQSSFDTMQRRNLEKQMVLRTKGLIRVHTVREKAFNGRLSGAFALN